MPSIKFTQDVIDGLRTPSSEGRVYYWDTTTPGFGLRVTGKGKKVWVAQYRVGGKSVMETLAPVTDLPLVKDARHRAEKSRLAARDGVNLVTERRAARVKEREEKETVTRKRVTLEQVTVEKMVDRYLREYCSRNLRASTLRETERMFDHDIFPTWGERPLTSITRRDVEQLLEYKAANGDRRHKTSGSPVMANRNLTRLKTFFGWCVRKELITTNPGLGIDKLVKEIGRDRVLDEREIVTFWHATEKLYSPYREIMRMLLLTGQRRSEVAGMCWSEVDLDKLHWIIPRERAKNGKQHIVHLSPQAVHIIEALPSQNDKLLFPSSRLGKIVIGFATTKVQLDAIMSKHLRKPVEPWVLHDLRRTAASGMAQLGIPPHVLDRVLNHTAGSISGVAAIYNRFQYLDERRDALNQWAAHVENLVNAKVRRVVL